MPKRKLKFRIGDTVEVDMRKEASVYYQARKDSNGRMRDYKTLIKAEELLAEQTLSPMISDVRKAVVTGMKMYCNGWFYPPGKFVGFSNMHPDEDPDPGGIDVQETVFLWCVRFGYMNKEHYFFEEDIIKVPGKGVFIPFKDTGWNSSLADKGREAMSRESKEWPRDSKGRFC